MNQRMSDYPTRFEVDYPELPSRGLALLGALLFIKGLLLIPHVIILYALGHSRISGCLHWILGCAHNRQVSRGPL